MASKSRSEIQAWKQRLVHQAEVKIQSLTTSANFKAYLKTMAKFHHYSLRNINLIYAQDPQATQVAGFKQWQKDFNRQVTKGAKAIRIAAPITKRLTPEQQRQLGTKRDQAIVGYRYLPVFDVRHTTGEQLPQTRDFIKTELGEHANVTPLYQAFKTYLNKTTGLTVTEQPMTENQARGYFAPKTNEIVIDSQESDQGMRLKTLYHEYAHSQLHGLTSAFKDRPRGYQEAQAEAVAYVAMQNIGIDTGDYSLGYVAMQNIGIDTGDYSLGYVATWAKDQTVIHQALSEIQQVSNKTLEISDELVRNLHHEKRMRKPHEAQETYRPVNSLQEMNAGLIEKPTDLEEIQPSQAPLVKEIVSKADFVHHYDYDEVGHEYSAYSTKEGNTFYEGGAEEYVEKDDLKNLLSSALNENEITLENVVGPKLTTKLTDKTQQFVNEHLTNDGLKQQVNGLKRLQKAVNPEQIIKLNHSLQLVNREASRRGLNLGQVKAARRKPISR